MFSHSPYIWCAVCGCVGVCMCVHMFICVYTVMRRLTMLLRSEKWVVRRSGRCANVIQCTYTNPDSTI